jgi:hypothetical protein
MAITVKKPFGPFPHGLLQPGCIIHHLLIAYAIFFLWRGFLK